MLDTKVANPGNNKNGFLELDWNNEFVEKLIDAGYSGETNEDIVDAWFKTIARQIPQDEGLDPDRGAKVPIDTKGIGKGKAELDIF